MDAAFGDMIRCRRICPRTGAGDEAKVFDGL